MKKSVDSIVMDTITRFAENYQVAISDGERARTTNYAYQFIEATKDKLVNPVSFYKTEYQKMIKPDYK